MITTINDLHHDSPTTTRFSKKPLARYIACLVSGVSLSLMASGGAFAQDTNNEDPQEADDALLEEVLVSGIRASQRGAIDLKKQAGTMLDAIVAEDVSKFPDKNATEALQRITGVQINRDFGEGSTINILSLIHI